jgi:uncharacterized membrane protein
MNLDLLPLGWVHLVASLAALAAGMLVLVRPKGTPVHKRRGRVYALTLLVTNVTALGIYRRGIFFFPHWLAIAALIVMTAGILAAHFKIPQKAWLHLHLTCLLTSLYILVGGGVNEVFLRVDLLRRLAPTLNSPAVGSTHLGVIIVFLALIGYFNAVLLWVSRKKRRVPSNEYAGSFGQNRVASTGQDRADDLCPALERR